MSLNQIGFFILPASADSVVDTFSLKDERFFDDEPIWKEQNILADSFSGVGLILPKAKSWWNPNATLYGDEDSNRLTIGFELEYVVSAEFRIDWTGNYIPILNDLIAFFVQHELIVLSENLEIVPLNVASFMDIIERAPQKVIYNKLRQKT